MTALELELRGVQFAVLGCYPPRVRGPRELAASIREGVASRMPRVETLPPAGPRGRCDTCGDALYPHKGGLCDLCHLARHKVLEQRMANA